uniref:N-acetyltransferase domain-containing protein n=1 Tax=Physcomitrium patens TaxID=3218 RepID=A0A7I4BD25_PHYPA
MASIGSTLGTGGGIRIRRVDPHDAMPLATMISDSFLAFNQSVNIPPHVDGFTLETSRDLMKHFTSTPTMYGVVAVEESSGALMAGGFMYPGDVYAIGPVFADNAFKGRGAGKAVMVALIEKVRSENAKSIRLCQVAANPISFGLYASLGFVPVECWMDLEGNVTTEEASSANRSCGFSPVTGVDVRRMEEADVKCCNELHKKTMGFDREQRIRMDIPNGAAWVAVRAGEIIMPILVL